MEPDNTQSTQAQTKLLFHTLTPLKDVDISVYAEALNFVFAKDEIRNVAISGSYGAGKSSVLETYKNNNANLKFIHISLADFKPHDSKDPSAKNGVPKSTSQGNSGNSSQNSKNSSTSAVANDVESSYESVLEGKILNQLLHQIEPERIPQTGFHVKQKVTAQRVCLEALMVVAFAGIMLYLVFFQRWKVFVTTFEGEWIYSFLKETTTNIARLILLIDECILFACGTGYAIWKQRTVGILKKVSLQGNEFEIGKENDESIFDRYLNEVLYLFEHADADVIVFEDLDRHESSDIFTRLREINTLINQQRQPHRKKCWLFQYCEKKKWRFFQYREKKKIRFFYLLRDDIFTTKDRAKFFDFVIPIVPVLDGSNAYDKFLEFFKQGGVEDLFTQHFLQGLSLYIDEMRILKNIINEFQVYYHRLNTTGLSSDRMLALITFKNIFPKDFAELQLNRGFVYGLFESKPIFTRVRRDQIGNEIASLQEQLELAGKAFLSDEEIDKIINYQDPYYRNNPFGDLRIKLIQTKAFYAAKRKTEHESTTALIRKLKDELTRLEGAKFRELITRENIDSVFCENIHTDGNGAETHFEEIKGSDYFALLKFLLREGYIDEGYSDYMTYFYPESLSRNDKTLLRSVADKKDLGYRYPLDSPEKVLGRLSVNDFEQPETLNFSLLNYVLKHGQEALAQKLLEQLKACNNIVFVNDFLQTVGVSLVVFVAKLNATWPGFFKAALTAADFQPDNRILWARMTLCVSHDETIKALNEDNCLRNFIAETQEFLDGEPFDQSKLIHGMQLIGMEMKAICREKANAELLKAVYERNLYALNASNVLLMLNLFYDDNSMAKLGSRSYSEIMKKPMSPLAKRVQAFINNYLDIVFQTCDGQIEDDPNDACDILNIKSVSSDRKAKYITQLKTKIEILEDVEDKSLWVDLLRLRKAVCSPENIVCFFKEKENTIDDVLVAFINNGKQEELCFSDDDLFEDDEQQAAFFESVVVCSGIENSRYESILGSLNQSYMEFDIEKMPIEKVSILITSIP